MKRAGGCYESIFLKVLNASALPRAALCAVVVVVVVVVVAAAAAAAAAVAVAVAVAAAASTAAVCGAVYLRAAMFLSSFSEQGIFLLPEGVLQLTVRLVPQHLPRAVLLLLCATSFAARGAACASALCHVRCCCCAQGTLL
jgi:uncharacterized membrane protein